MTQTIFAQAVLREAELVGANLRESDLSDADLARIEEAMPADAAAGARYPEPQMAHLDSER